MELIPFFSNKDLSIINRSFLYGDGLFETIRIINGKGLFLVDHFERLQNGASALQYDMNQLETFETFKNVIQQFLKSNNNPLSARIRVTLFRTNGEFYNPSNKKTDFIITGKTLTEEKYRINSTPISFGINKEFIKDYSLLSSIKTTSALLYVLAGQWTTANHYNECVLLNSKGNVVEGYKSNIFIVKNNALITPPISEGCLNGIMRKQIVNLCKQNNININENVVTIDTLNKADEILFTNTISGITSSNVSNNSISHKLISLLNNSIR